MNKLHKALDRLHAGRKKEEGFTLIELIIVVVIIGILTAIAIPSYGAIQGTARANSVKAAASDTYSAIVSNVANGKSVGDAITDATAKYPASGDIIVTATGTSEDNVVVTAKWKDGKYETSRGTADAPANQ